MEGVFVIKEKEPSAPVVTFANGWFFGLNPLMLFPTLSVMTRGSCWLGVKPAPLTVILAPTLAMVGVTSMRGPVVALFMGTVIWGRSAVATGLKTTCWPEDVWVVELVPLFDLIVA